MPIHRPARGEEFRVRLGGEIELAEGSHIHDGDDKAGDKCGCGFSDRGQPEEQRNQRKLEHEACHQ